MCKHSIILNTSKVKDLDKVAESLVKSNTRTEKSGVGLLCAGESGVYVEKSLKVDSFRPFHTSGESFPWSVKTSESLGERNQTFTGPLIIHGRTSTNEVSLVNTHPISKEGYHVTHNGVVTNLGPKYKKFTTNDTEDILHYFLKERGKTRSIEKYLSGYYSFFCYVEETGDTHIVKDSIASLYSAYIQEIDSLIFSTSDFSISQLCLDLGWTSPLIEKVNDDLHLIFKGNELISMNSIKSLGYSRRESEFAGKSLGRSLDTPLSTPEKEKDSYKHFLNSVKNMGPQDQILNMEGLQIDSKDFFKLSPRERKTHYLCRIDGSEVTSEYDSRSEEIWGKI